MLVQVIQGVLEHLVWEGGAWGTSKVTSVLYFSFSLIRASISFSPSLERWSSWIFSFCYCGGKILVELEMIFFPLNRLIIKILYVATFPVKSLGFASRNFLFHFLYLESYVPYFLISSWRII